MTTRKMATTQALTTLIGCGLLIIALACGTSLAAPGDLDRDFGQGGKAALTTGGQCSHGALLVQPDDKIVFAGGIHDGAQCDFIVERRNPDGSIDTTFGAAGKSITPIGTGHNFADAIVRQSDGKLVAAGKSNGSLGLARYTADGNLDTTFGSGGAVVSSAVFLGSRFGFSLQSDDKLVVAGRAFVSGQEDTRLVRFNADGTLDGTFGSGGIVTTAVDPIEYDAAHALTIQPDGKLVAAGIRVAGGATDLVLVRYNDDGSLDGSFGTLGSVVTPVPPQGLYWFDPELALTLQPDGRPVVLGTVWANDPPLSVTDFGVFRYNSDGSLDPSFGSSGRVTTAVATWTNYAFTLLRQPDGKLVAGGYGVEYEPSFAPGTAILVRYNADGSLDESFGNEGRVYNPVGAAVALGLQSDGRMVASSGTHLLRYLGDGSASCTTCDERCVVLPGVISWWRAEGDADDSGAFNDGSFSAVTFADGKVGQAFDLSTGSVTVPHHWSLDVAASGFSVELWANGPPAPGVHGLLDQTAGGTSGWKFESNGGSLSFSIGDGAALTTVSSGGAVLDGSFHHIAGTWDASTGAAKLYVDGVLQGTSAPVTPASAANALVMGQSFAGLIDEVVLYHRTLSPGEVADVENAGGRGHCPPCSGAGIMKGKVSVTKLNAPAGDENFSFKGELILDSVNPAPIQLTNNGARVVLFDALGAPVLDLSAPDGFFNAVSKRGWKSKRGYGSNELVDLNKMTYLDKTKSARPIKMQVADASRRVPSLLKFKLTAKNLDISVANLPLVAKLYLNTPPNDATQCGVAPFSVTGCKFSSSHNRVTCK